MCKIKLIDDDKENIEEKIENDNNKDLFDILLSKNNKEEIDEEYWFDWLWLA